VTTIALCPGLKLSTYETTQIYHRVLTWCEAVSRLHVFETDILISFPRVSYSDASSLEWNLLYSVLAYLRMVFACICQSGNYLATVSVFQG
jgi:hypothetical protein